MTSSSSIPVVSDGRRPVEGACSSGLLDAISAPVVILTRRRDVMFANVAFRHQFSESGADMADHRIGDLLGCRVVARAPAGCGTARACASCSFKSSIADADDVTATFSERVLSVGGRSFEVEFTAQAVPDDPELVICTLQDVSDRMQRIEFEQMFFHDVLNTAGAVQTAADLLELPGQDDLVGIIRDTSRQLVGALTHHRLLALAEKGTLERDPRSVELLDEVVVPAVTQFAVDAITDGIGAVVRTESQEIRVTTDPTLLRRVLDNLIRNAREASEPGDAVAVGVGPAPGGGAVLTVHNRLAPPPSVADRMFSRAFSTKGPGRGYGTRSVLVLTERYLGGTVAADFSNGTTIAVTLPTTIDR